MSRTDEIIKILRRQEDYETVAKEIEKLFEVEGKVQYVTQHSIGGLWHDAYIRSTFDELAKINKTELSSYKEKGKRRLLKRTINNQIIEE